MKKLDDIVVGPTEPQQKEPTEALSDFLIKYFGVFPKEPKPMFTPWWVTEPTKKEVEANAIKTAKALSTQLAYLRKELESWKIDWKNFNKKLFDVYSSNVEYFSGNIKDTQAAIDLLRTNLRLSDSLFDDAANFVNSEVNMLDKFVKKLNETELAIRNSKVKKEE